jgi:circadian clock protein KaiC
MNKAAVPAAPLSTGTPGLDTVLHGGLTRERIYLIQGVPGSGKTTMALQFLMQGAANGERVLFIALSETAQELHESAASHGWSLDGIEIHELLPMGDQLDPAQQYTMFHPSEVELGEATHRILETVEQARPQRLVIDSLAEIRLLAGTTLRFRRQVLALKQFFTGKGITVLLLDECQANQQELHVHTIVHGAIELDQMRPEYGGDRRRLRVSKYRGRSFFGGFHDYVIETGGVRVFPRLVAAHHRRDAETSFMPSGLPRSRHQHAADRRRRHGQVVAGRALRGDGCPARRALGDVPVRRKRAIDAHPFAWNWFRHAAPHRLRHGPRAVAGSGGALAG